jgi:valine dehydrogenase (NAD+)
MDIVAETCSYVTGRSPERGGAGDSGILTAFGVLQGLRAAVAHCFGEPTTLAGLRVGVAGVGKVGRRLVDHLVREGAVVCVTDPDGAAVAGVRERHPAVRAVGDVHELLAEALDVYSPNALGGAIDPETAATLSARIVCGGANNQLTDPALAQVLADRGIVYAPDYLVNSGGVIQVADELQGYSEERARARVAQIYDTTLAVLRAADEAGETPLEAAERFARQRIAQSGSPDGRWPRRPDHTG